MKRIVPERKKRKKREPTMRVGTGAVTLDDQRRPVADLTRLSLVEPDHAAS